MSNAVPPTSMMADTNRLREPPALREGPTDSPVDKKEVAKPKGAEPCQVSCKERPNVALREARTTQGVGLIACIGRGKLCL
jgi:hypothetical protein